MPEELQESTAQEMPLEVFDQEVLDLARRVTVASADYPEQVGRIVCAYEIADHVVDFRFESHMKGYEGWQWSVTLFQDVERGVWTVNESTLIPAEGSLLPPQWIPWKNRLEPSDLSVTDVLGTDHDDERLERGFRKTRSLDDVLKQIEQLHNIQRLRSIQNPDHHDDLATADIVSDTGSGISTSTSTSTSADISTAGISTNSTSDSVADTDNGPDSVSAEKSDSIVNLIDTANICNIVPDHAGGTSDAQMNADSVPAGGVSDTAAEAALSDEVIAERLVALEKERDELLEQRDIVQQMELSRRRVLTPLGRAQAAERWYNGQPGPKSLSTKVARGAICQTCGFFIPLTGELNVMFGVCANAWSPDDGRVVSRDHGCGQHSQIEPPTAASLWVQSKPAFDDMHIDIVAQAPRVERESIDAIEQAEFDGQNDDHNDVYQPEQPDA